MNRLTAAILGTALVFGRPVFAADPPAGGGAQAELVAQLQGKGKTPLTAKTAAEFETAYTTALPALLDKVTTDDLALQNVAFHASRPGAEVERAALGKVLAGKLTADAPVDLKLVLLRHVQRIGRAEVVQAVAGLLGDADANVRESARRALAGNPSKEAGDTLRAAIDKATDPAWKGALVGALEYRREPGDAAYFAKLVTTANEPDAVRVPALLALARTGDATAAKTLADARMDRSPVIKHAANDAYLLMADRLTPTDKDAAASIYREYLTSPAPYRYAGIIGLGRTSRASEMGPFVDLLGHTDVEARGAALSVLARHKDKLVAAAIAEKVKGADAQAKPWLIRALADQGGKEHLPVFVAAASDPDEALRIQAVRALGVAGDASALPLLLKSAQAKGDEQVMARMALENLPGEEIDKGLMPLVAKGSTAERIEAVRALGARNATAALGSIVAAAGADAEQTVRNEAYRSIGLLGDYAAVPQVIKLVEGAKEDADRDGAGKALAALVRKNDDLAARLTPVVDAMKAAAAPEAKAAFLAVLGQVGGAPALAAVREAVKSTDEKTHEAAVRALTNWTDDAPLKDLLALAKEEKKENLAILSLRGHIRLLGINRDKRKVEENLKLFGAALAACKRPDEKKQVLGGLGDIKDVKALTAIAPLLDDAALVNEAAAAALKVADKYADKDKALTRSTLEKVRAVSKNDGHKKQAGEILKKLGGEEKKDPKKAA